MLPNSNKRSLTPIVNQEGNSSGTPSRQATQSNGSTHNTTVSSSHGPNIFNRSNAKENYYRHKQQPFPTFVLDRLATDVSENPDSLTTDAEKLHQHEMATGVFQDPFTKSFKDTNGNVSWNKFLGTIQGRLAYPEQQVHRDDNSSILKSYKLEEDWKGEEHLNDIFNYSPDAVDDLEKNGYSEGGKSGVLDPENARYRSKAVYWINENKKDWKPKLADVLTNNSYIPLFFRLFTVLLTCVALGMACRIKVLSDRVDSENHVSQQPSTIMAIVVQSVAIAYLFYISWDEFTSQPLGLRDPQAKIRLILLDLLFIILSSANLALSFNTLYDSRWVCTGSIAVKEDSLQGSMCQKQRTLAAFLFLILVTWCITFTISIIRVLQMVSRREDRPS